MPKLRKHKPSNNSDDLPPHDADAERGVLGCILQDADCLAVCRQQLPCPDVFYDLRHSTVYQAAIAVADAKKVPDIIAVQSHLKHVGTLADIGGIAYLSQMVDSIPSVANLDTYLDIVLERWEMRRIITTCTDVISSVRNADGNDPSETLWMARSSLASIANKKAPSAEQVWSVRQLANFDADADPNALVGLRNGKATRYLCRGYGAWLIGPSGVGKSSLITQLSVSLALGKPLFGIAPLRPLRVLIVQAENDEGDSAEMIQGILKTLEIDEFNAQDGQMDALNNRIKFVTEKRTVGDAFCSWLGGQIESHLADIVFVDPFLSFAGIDVNRQDQCTRFLRQGLNPVLAATGAMLIGAHHTGKPKRDKDVRGMTAIDYAYSGIGSSELVNWARAVMVLSQLGDGIHYEIKFPKRGGRSGALHPDGSPAYSIFLRHARDKICWEQVDAPEEQKAADAHTGPRPKKKSRVDEIVASNLHEVLSKCPPEGESATALGHRFHAWSIKAKLPLGLTLCRRDLLYALGSDECKKLTYDEASKLWFKGANA